MAEPSPPLPSTAATYTVRAPLPAGGAVHHRCQLLGSLRSTTCGCVAEGWRRAHTASPSGATTTSSLTPFSTGHIPATGAPAQNTPCPASGPSKASISRAKLLLLHCWYG